jgi:hypothetical protein
MHIALQGALTGLVIGLIMLGGDYLVLRGAARERAVKQHKKVPEFDGTERARIRSLAMFCVILPPIFALFFWMIWG